MAASFKLKPVAQAILSVFFASTISVAHGQETEAEVNQIETSVEATKSNSKKPTKRSDTEIEVIQVKGYLGSIQKSLNEKRLADSVSDSIFAEDIGKSTDQNIADALSRVTGISVQTKNGEGTRISVRGAESRLNQISLNGVALTSSISGSGGSNSTSDQSVDLSTLSSDILSSISVIKTSAADHDEGSLGANVILRTVKPLTLANDKRVVEVQGRYNEYSEDEDSKITGAFSEKFLDDTLGFMVTATSETNATRRDEVSGDWLRPYQVVDVREGGATSEQTGLPTTTAQKAIYASSKGFNTNLDNTKRDTYTSAVQWLPTDSTDIQFDVSYSTFESHNDAHGISVSAADFNTPERRNLATDPQHEWWRIDEQNHTIGKMFNRHATGALRRNVGGNETETLASTLKLNQEITDNLSMELTAGYSKTDFGSLPNTTLSTSTWNFIPLNTLTKVPLSMLEPIGYDCQGTSCDLKVGTVPFIYVPEGINNNQNNISTSGFNPLDPYGNHLGYVAKYNEKSIDDNKSVFLDFDYVVDKFNITTIEFGAKYSNRIKTVSTNYQTLEGPGTTVFDPVTGLPVQASSGIADVALVDVITGTGLPVNDFMKGLIPNSSAYNSDFLKGWGVLDSDKAFKEIFGIENSELVSNKTGDREIEQENVSLYLKTNFELMDGRLTGNLGVRYVRTDNDSSGFSTIQYGSQDRNFDVADLIYNKQIANSQLENCEGGQSARLDGFGPNAITATGYPCYEPRFNPDGILQVAYDQNGNVTSIDKNIAGARGWWFNYRHADPSTQKQYGQWLVDQGVIAKAEDIFRRTYASTGEGNSELFLPSLNINYQINDEMIGRFATSQTMARPGFDSMRPGFNITEDVWGQFSRGTSYDPNLQPLTSNNLDLSFEWYFNESGNVSLAYFHKDMNDFEESVKDTIYFKDYRTAYDAETINWKDTVIPIVPGMDATNSDCMPDRVPQDRIGNSLNFGCEPMEATFVRNGKSATINGAEFAYTQNYSFLPSFWSGLGTSFNYTYSKSEVDAEVLELTGRSLKALPMNYTPRHSLNSTLFWEKDGHQLRLAYRYSSEQLVNRGLTNGAEWMDDTQNLDFSATYHFNEYVDFSFHALNLTDESTRTFFTSTSMDLGLVDANGDPMLFDEGDALDGGADTSRTVREWKTGRQFRLTARVSF